LNITLYDFSVWVAPLVFAKASAIRKPTFAEKWNTNRQLGFGEVDWVKLEDGLPQYSDMVPT
jgi:hypothetical protein